MATPGVVQRNTVPSCSTREVTMIVFMKKQPFVQKAKRDFMKIAVSGACSRKKKENALNASPSRHQHPDQRVKFTIRADVSFVRGLDRIAPRTRRVRRNPRNLGA